MKKTLKIFTLAVAVVFTACTIAKAEPKFTPLNFEDSAKIKTSTSSSGATTTAKSGQSGTIILDPSQVTGGSKMQSAILQLDNAEVDVRNKLLNYRANYAEIDGKYQTTKEERKAAKKKIKQAEKQIKNMESAKKKIRKNFEQKNNV